MSLGQPHPQGNLTSIRVQRRVQPPTHSRVQRRDTAVYFAVLRGALVALVAADRSENVLAWSLVVSQDQHINAV